MATMQILNQHAGPLPLTVPFKAISDAPMLLQVYGSVWSQHANVLIGIAISIDNNQVGVAQIYSNNTAVHREVVPAFIPIQLDVTKPHSLTLSLLNGNTISDLNDFFTVAISY